MHQPLFQVDSFTSQPFAGNPAGVCILDEPTDDRWMQHIAREMNLAETAFLHEQDGGYALRWFTPTIEVALCGHATLASAHILYEKGYVTNKEAIRFSTASGMLTATKH